MKITILSSNLIKNKNTLKANSEKSIKQPKLLPSSTKTSKILKKKSKTGYFVKEGKSFDNTNASVHDNELEKIMVIKEEPKINSIKEPINQNQLNFCQAEEEEVLKGEGLGIGGDNLSCHSEIFMKNISKNHESNDIRDLGREDDNFANISIDMEFSGKMHLMEEPKDPEISDFEEEFGMKELGANEEVLSHNSSLLHSNFNQPSSVDFNYF